MCCYKAFEFSYIYKRKNHFSKFLFEFTDNCIIIHYKESNNKLTTICIIKSIRLKQKFINLFIDELKELIKEKEKMLKPDTYIMKFTEEETKKVIDNILDKLK